MSKKILSEEITTNQIVCADVLDGLRRIRPESVHLIVTSCPFNVGVEYKNHNDVMPHKSYLDWLLRVWSDCYRVLVPGGRICINIDATMTWDDIKWMKSVSKLPLILKGIMCAEDAKKALEYDV